MLERICKGGGGGLPGILCSPFHLDRVAVSRYQTFYEFFSPSFLTGNVFAAAFAWQNKIYSELLNAAHIKTGIARSFEFLLRLYSSAFCKPHDAFFLCHPSFLAWAIFVFVSREMQLHFIDSLFIRFAGRDGIPRVFVLLLLGSEDSVGKWGSSGCFFSLFILTLFVFLVTLFDILLT